MKKILLPLFALIFLQASAQTVDEIIQKYSATMGDLEAIKKITSIKISGIFSVQENDFPLTTQVVNEKAMRTDIDIMGQLVTNCYFNGKGWKVNPFVGIPSPTEVSDTELNDFKEQCFISGSLMDYKARGHKVELKGEADVGGIKTYKIVLTRNDGKMSDYYISQADFTLKKSVTVREFQGQGLEIETFYSNLKDFNGVKFFMTLVSKTDGQVIQTIKLDQAEMNVPIDERIFEMSK